MQIEYIIAQTSVEAEKQRDGYPVAADLEQEETPAVQDAQLSLLDLGNALDVSDDGNWTTYSTNFKPTPEERQTKQDATTKKHVLNLVKYMNLANADPNDPVVPMEEDEDDEKEKALATEETAAPTSLLLDLAASGSGNWTTYSTTFKPTPEERQAKQDATAKQHVSNLIKLMSQKKISIIKVKPK
jgi:hypothetical protein|tara:strand:- start:157 stop:714 length:558 start_codon:yes stop_codon:yes gene_type:complete